MIAPAPAPRTDAPRIQAQAQILAQGGRDYTIPSPQGPAAPAVPLPGAPLPGSQIPGAPLPQAAAGTQAAPDPFAGLGAAPTTTEVVLGGAALAVLAVLFLFVRRGVRAHLIDRRATVGAADGASWMLFSALTTTAALLVTATVGRLWQAWAGLAAGLVLCLALFGAALLLFLRAPARRR